MKTYTENEVTGLLAAQRENIARFVVILTEEKDTRIAKEGREIARAIRRAEYLTDRRSTPGAGTSSCPNSWEVSK